jgi:uncharacterized protein (TIGR00369 family)
MDSAEFERLYKQMCKFDSHLGLELTVRAPGDITYRMEIKDHHLTFPDACHGGVISAMMDAVLGLTVLSWAISQGKSCSTVEFKTNIVSLAKPGDQLEGTGVIDSIGSRLVVAGGQIIEVRSRRLVAKGMGTFALYPLAKKTDVLNTLEPEST